MKKAEKQKNLYDLQYNTYLNHLNIVLIVSATLIITFWFAFELPVFYISLLLKIIFTFVIGTIALLIGIFIYVKLNSIKKNLMKLR